MNYGACSNCGDIGFLDFNGICVDRCNIDVVVAPPIQPRINRKDEKEMKLIATIQVTVQVGEDSWTRETVAYEISKKETAEELFVRIMADVKGATCRDNCIKITSVKEAADE